MRNYILTLFCFCSSVLWSQQLNIDSFKSAINSNRLGDREIIKPKCELMYHQKTNSLLAIENRKLGISATNKASDSPYEIYGYSNMVLLYPADKIFCYMDSTKRVLDKSTDKNNQAVGFGKMGLMHVHLGDKEGIEHIYISLKLAALKKNLQVMAFKYSNWLSFFSTDSENSGKHSKLAVSHALTSKHPHTLWRAHSLRQLSYLLAFEKTKKHGFIHLTFNQLKSALKVYGLNPTYARKSLSISRLTNLFYTYAFKDELIPDTAKLEAVRYYSTKALVFPMLSNDWNTIKHWLIRIEKALIHIKLAESKSLYVELIPIVSNCEHQFQNKDKLTHPSTQLYDKMGEYQKSIQSFKTAFHYYQQYYDDKYTKIDQQQQAKFEITKKKNEFKKKYNLLYIGLGISSFPLILFIAFKINYVKRKKEEIQPLEKLKGEQSESLEIGRDIQLTDKSTIFQHLQQNTQDTVALKKRESVNITKTEQPLDKTFEEFESIIKKNHPEFYNCLQERASHKLSALDLKYCVYIFMKMPSKEMANLLHVEPKTIRMNKYRLKLKFKLTKSDNLEEFIQNII